MADARLRSELVTLDSHRGIVDLEREQAELTKLTGRAVYVLTRAAVERMDNPLRRRSILTQVRTLYVA